MIKTTIENRQEGGGPDMEELIRDNNRNLELCRQYGYDYAMIHRAYPTGVDPFEMQKEGACRTFFFRVGINLPLRLWVCGAF